MGKPAPEKTNRNNKIINDYTKKLMTIYDIGLKHDIRPQRVYQILAKYGIPLRKKELK